MTVKSRFFLYVPLLYTAVFVVLLAYAIPVLGSYEDSFEPVDAAGTPRIFYGEQDLDKSERLAVISLHAAGFPTAAVISMLQPADDRNLVTPAFINLALVWTVALFAFVWHRQSIRHSTAAR